MEGSVRVNLKRVRRLSPGRYRSWLIVPAGEYFSFSFAPGTKVREVEVREDGKGNRAIRFK